MNARVGYDPRLAEILRAAGSLFHRREKEPFQELLEEALRRAPMRLDIHFCLASHFIQIDLPKKGLAAYERIHQLFPRDADALFHLAHWRRFDGDAQGAEDALRLLADARPEKAADLKRIWSSIDAWTDVDVTDVLPDARGDENICLVALGYRLASDGSMLPPLVARLEKTLEAANRWPGAIIVATGGVPCAGKVEAVEMRRWLTARGVARDRIREEGYARDCVENLLFARPYLDAENAGRAIIVTAAGNVRRTGAALETIAWTCGSAWKTSAVAASGETFSSFRDDGGDRLKVYRDILRAYGVPMMASYPDLAER